VKLSEIYQIADKIAPFRLSLEYCKNYDAYDNSGILVDTGEEIKGILCSLDLSQAAIDKALEVGANLIITHHPAIYGKIANVCEGDSLGNKLIKCIQKGISVISMHLNLDCARGGIDESLACGILRSSGKTTGAGTHLQEIMHLLSEGGYGRVYEIGESTLGALKENMQKEFCTDRILVYGDEQRKIKRVASFCGAGVDEGAISFALDNMGERADVIVSSDFKHHLITSALEEGLAVVVLTHYASENYGFKNYYEKIRRQVEIPCVFHTDENLL